MSLFSTFYFGNATTVADALNAGRCDDISASAPLPPCEFSGGIRVPFLMEEDFDTLFAMGAQIDNRVPKQFRLTFARQLSDPSDDETGTYLLRPDACAAFAALPTTLFQRFSDEWNARRQRERASASRHGCLWDAALWKLLGGFTLGFGAFAAVERSVIPLYYLAGAWLLLIGGALFLDRPRRKRASQQRAVDWQPRLHELQQRITQAMANGFDVVYHWSL